MRLPIDVSIVTMALSSVVSEIFNVKKCRDLEIGVRGPLRSLKVVPFDRLPTVSYYCSIVTLSVRCTVFEIFDSDFETRVKGHSRSSELTWIDSPPMTSC